MNFRALSILVWVISAGIPDGSRACNVPVFRYAMERWPADPYQVLVYHTAGPPGVAFELLQNGIRDPNGPANYSLRSIDVATPEGQTLAAQRSIAEYPWVEVYYPYHAPVRSPVWSGPLTLENARRILNSPGRSRLAQRLLSGEVAVWVLIRSGREQKDRRALESLKTHLKQASAMLRIPETGVDLDGNPLTVTDFKTYPVRFGLMAIVRSDAEEDLLIGSLLNSEPDLRQYDEPMAFPVFGRGRALYALIGEGIHEKNIQEACASMLGWCSCEIKSMTPGTDLLIAADWSRPFGGRMVKDPEVPLTGLSAFLKKEPPARKAETRAAPKAAALCERVSPARGARTAPDDTPAEMPGPGESPLVRNVLYLGGAGGVAILALSGILAVKARRRAAGSGGQP